MKADPTDLLKNVWADNQPLRSTKDVALDSRKLDEIIASIFCSGPFYFYVVDFYDMKINYMSPLVRDIHGLDPEKATFQDILDQIHPDDLSFVTKAEEKTWELLYKTINYPRNLNYKISYCFRFKTIDGTYQLFNHQSVLLTADEHGGMSKSLNIHTNISHLTSQNNFKVSAIGMNGEPSYLNLEVLNEPMKVVQSISLFSNREIEVIRLITEGLTTQQIAEKLFVSVNTIKTHRRNILDKSGTKNIGELITRCITEGLI